MPHSDRGAEIFWISRYLEASEVCRVRLAQLAHLQVLP